MWDGDGAFRSLPYTTLDVTGALATAGNTVVLALETMHPTPTAIMQLQLQLSNGKTMIFVSLGLSSLFFIVALSLSLNLALARALFHARALFSVI